MHYNSFTETTKTLLILIKNFKYDYLELVQLIMHIFCTQLLQRYSNGANYKNNLRNIEDPKTEYDK